MEQILELEITDDITSIRNWIETVVPVLVCQARQQGQPHKSAAPRLLLVAPRKNQAVQSLVNLKVLARIAKNRAVELAIVTTHPTVMDYAKEASMKTFGSVGNARRAGWIKAAAATLPAKSALYPATAPAGRVAPKRRQRKKYVLVLGSGRIGLLQQAAGLVLAIGLAAVLLVGVVALLPQATVTLVPVAKPVETELIVKANPAVKSVNFETLEFPARVSQVELALAGQIETVETELAPVGKAQGRVVFINRTDAPQTIPISTTVATSAGQQIEFITTFTATIPAGVGAITATTVMAVEPGPQGNVSAGKITRFTNQNFGLVARVINEETFSGGTKEPARVVVQDDKERLRAHLQQLVYQEGLKQLRDALGEQEFISPETLQVIVLDVSYREFAGDVSDTFSGEMQAVVRGTVVGGYNANRLALAALQSQVPPGYELDIEGLHFGAGEVLDVSEGLVTFKVFANGRATPVIDPHRVAGDVTWLSIGEAQARLEKIYPLVAAPGVEVTPEWAGAWFGRLPLSSVRIKVIIGEAVLPALAGG
jgi:hypothetical protein